MCSARGQARAAHCRQEIINLLLDALRGSMAACWPQKAAHEVSDCSHALFWACLCQSNHIKVSSYFNLSRCTEIWSICYLEDFLVWQRSTPGVSDSLSWLPTREARPTKQVFCSKQGCLVFKTCADVSFNNYWSDDVEKVSRWWFRGGVWLLLGAAIVGTQSNKPYIASCCSG